MRTRKNWRRMCSPATVKMKSFASLFKGCGFQRQSLWPLVALRAAAKRFGAQPLKAALGAEIERNTLSCEAHFGGLIAAISGRRGFLQEKKPLCQRFQIGSKKE